jgi:glycosyltransferase involved in cell wall biosynthesis
MKLSVCIATYNGEKYIEEQLKSILNQIGQNDEIVISDDDSTDKTLEIIKSFGDSRIKLLQNNGERPKKLISNFENALFNANGDVIFLSDQDDIWLDGKVNQIMKALESNDLIVSDCTVVDANLGIIHDSFFQIRNSGSGLLKNFYKNSYIGCCMAFNRKIYDLILPFPKNIPMHDWWIGIVAEIYGKIKFLDEKLLLYRRHDNNVSLSSEQSGKSFLEKISLRLNLLTSLGYFYLHKTKK